MDSPSADCVDARARKRAYNKLYYRANKARLLAYSRAYQKFHRPKLNAQQRARYDESARLRKRSYYHRNRDRLLAQKRDYYSRNRQLIKSYRARNARKIHAANSRWHRENRDRIRERKRAESRRRRERITEQISGNLRRQIGRRIKKGGSKFARSEALLGCTFEEFRQHLERQFRRGMKWQNYGRAWHIDHIIPCSAFDLTRPEHVRQCFHFTNLQPLWAKANIRKGAKITDPQLKLLL